MNKLIEKRTAVIFVLIACMAGMLFSLDRWYAGYSDGKKEMIGRLETAPDGWKLDAEVVGRGVDGRYYRFPYSGDYPQAGKKYYVEGGYVHLIK
jgi:hypothetical protein